MKYNIFVSDFDGTLVRSDGTVSQKNRAAIKRYTERGGKFVVCSGRMTGAILPRVRELALTGLVASYQGMVVSEIASGKVIQTAAFEDSLAYEAVERTVALGYHTHVYTADELYCNRDDEALEYYERVCRVKANIVADLASFARCNRLHIIKIVVMIPKEERAEAARRMRQALPASCAVTCSAEYLVEATPAGKDKGEAVKFLSEYYNVPLSRIAAIGDMGNDLPMVAAAGGKFAVENAEEELKAIATVVPSCEDDGVAAALDRAMEE